MTSLLQRTLGPAALVVALVGSLAAPAQAGGAVGEKAADFGGKWINHADTTLEALRGRVVLIEFWRTW